MYYGEYIRSLQIDDLCIFVAVHIVGFCPRLRRLEFRKAEFIALHFLESNVNTNVATILNPNAAV